ncbi:hypothetical protein [Thauera humireducens]|uniref:hypothetical protein n=1 Tax=Thauera humireducens TaxID=1134435 RepID=UPI003120373B
MNETIKDEKDGKPGKVGYEINFNRYFYVLQATPQTRGHRRRNSGDGEALR